MILESNLKVVTKVSPKEFQYAIQLWNMQKVIWKQLIKMHPTHLKKFQEQFSEIWLWQTFFNKKFIWTDIKP